MVALEKLEKLRKLCGKPAAEGLKTDEISTFALSSPELMAAIDDALAKYANLTEDLKNKIKTSDESAVIQWLQSGFVNFYAADVIQPFIALSAAGPWIVSLYGRVFYDTGGYGMLGSGHNPAAIVPSLNQSEVMANIMTPNLIQKEFCDALFNEIGHTRTGGKRRPFAKFICMNSGSEAMTVALRFSDIVMKQKMEKLGTKERRTKIVAMSRGFHGRTERPAHISDSSREAYQKYLATFMEKDELVTVPINDKEALCATWEKITADGYMIEALVLEPVMGEGEPGRAVTPEFYQTARRLTEEHGCCLIVDSIQAGLRGLGCLSIMDYPGFQELDPPDMESYSKALNAGQFPLSVLALTDKAASFYKTGVYGNTMTTNPRALRVGLSVLNGITPAFRQNIRERGAEMLLKLKTLNQELNGVMTRIEGTGLLVAAHFDPANIKVLGVNGIETAMRKKGINIIHGGKNALRFTPHFFMISQEIDLILRVLKESINDILKQKK